ncbi:MAG: FtsQ-type POTRA domain-containing protein [Cyanothece sp. SIO1E1]|nr:FtsQ-type POTRA domain-containing protein [Cyanothece sp. SIO1E1]
MTNMASTSPAELAERRQKLRQQRRVRLLQAIWRVLTICGLSAGLLWVITLPAWVIREPSQIEVNGNQLLSTSTIRSLLPLEYPDFLLSLQPQIIAQQLEARAPIAKATITRRLIPPGLMIQIQERHPVAVVLPEPIDQTIQGSSASTVSDLSPVGVLDASGFWMPLTSFTSLNDPPELPTLRIRGIEEHKRPHWPRIYELVSQSPVKIFEIDWRDSANLILLTELGIVHFGPYSPQLDEQLIALDQIRKLPELLNREEIAYIDLKHPDAPAVQIIEEASK